jgi:hypothetical protein|tara:strand:- start:609 stop:1160 length:552 start_codon:yes stop_codon:yes gene_type:complete
VEINYWIILLIFYLVSRWMRNKARRGLPGPPAEDQPEPIRRGKEKVPESIPKWMKDLGLLDLIEKDEGEGVTAEDLQAEKEMTLRDEIESYEEMVPAEEPEAVEPLPSEAPAIDSFGFRLEGETDSLQKAREDRIRSQAEPRRVRRNVGRFIRDPQNLCDIIVLREVLGPPRGMDRFRYRRHF